MEARVGVARTGGFRTGPATAESGVAGTTAKVAAAGKRNAASSYRPGRCTIWHNAPHETSDVTTLSADVTGVPPAFYFVPPGGSDVAAPAPGLSPLLALPTSWSSSYAPVALTTLFGSPVTGSRPFLEALEDGSTRPQPWVKVDNVGLT
ncbi:UNVERIFIED_CONTAM: hypothetical protein FKN15_058046 [Acipenser sinensis]